MRYPIAFALLAGLMALLVFAMPSPVKADSPPDASIDLEIASLQKKIAVLQAALDGLRAQKAAGVTSAPVAIPAAATTCSTAGCSGSTVAGAAATVRQRTVFRGGGRVGIFRGRRASSSSCGG